MCFKTLDTSPKNSKFWGVTLYFGGATMRFTAWSPGQEKTTNRPSEIHLSALGPKAYKKRLFGRTEFPEKATALKYLAKPRYSSWGPKYGHEPLPEKVSGLSDHMESHKQG